MAATPDRPAGDSAGRGASESGAPARRRRLVTALVRVLASAFVLAATYGGSVLWRCRSASESHSRWIGSAYAPDESFGYFPVPRRVAYHSLQFGERVPVLFDDGGFRVPIGADPSDLERDEKILFLGCSFTHGYGVPAEETFAWLASEALGARCLNAGGSGWGLAHMVLRARRDVPRVHPSWVVVQFSDWLVDRSMQIYGPTNWGLSPAPYLYETGGEVRVHPPAFLSGNFDVPISEYAGKGLLTFARHVGFPLFVRDDALALATLFRRTLGTLPAPLPSRAEVLDFAYSEILRICREEGARMLVVQVPRGYSEEPYEDDVPKLDCPVVDTYSVLLGELREASKEAWTEAYAFWRGTPPVVVDKHPNARAHELIAGVIVSAVRANSGR